MFTPPPPPWSLRRLERRAGAARLIDIYIYATAAQTSERLSPRAEDRKIAGSMINVERPAIAGRGRGAENTLTHSLYHRLQNPPHLIAASCRRGRTKGGGELSERSRRQKQNAARRTGQSVHIKPDHVHRTPRCSGGDPWLPFIPCFMVGFYCPEETRRSGRTSSSRKTAEKLIKLELLHTFYLLEICLKEPLQNPESL